LAVLLCGLNLASLFRADCNPCGAWLAFYPDRYCGMKGFQNETSGAYIACQFVFHQKDKRENQQPGNLSI
jgi:hypothetical protein